MVRNILHILRTYVLTFRLILSNERRIFILIFIIIFILTATPAVLNLLAGLVV